jgi:hypothetical protein
MSHDNPGWTFGFVPSAAAWNAEFGFKADWALPIDVLVGLNQGYMIGNAGGAVVPIAIGAGLSLTPGGTLMSLDAVIDSLSNDFTLVANELELTSVVTAGIFNFGSVSATGRIISYSSIAYLTGNQNITISGDATGSGSTSISLTLGSVVAGGTTGGAGSIVASVTYNNKGLVTGATSRPSGGQITLQATASSTITVTPTLGIEDYWIIGPASGGTVPVTIGSASQLGQKIIMNISQGATPATWTFGTTGAGMNFSSSLPAPTITATANKRDNLVFIANEGTALWDFEAITQGFSP